MRKRRASLALAAAFAAAAALCAGGCRDNTTCTPGTRLCTEDDGSGYEGDPFKGGGTQLRICSTTGKGADEDGELIVEKDCGKDDLICFEDVGCDADDHNFDGCIDPKCSSATGSLCVEEGATSCLLDVAAICTRGADDCLTWNIVADCSDDGLQCAYDGSGNAACR